MSKALVVEQKSVDFLTSAAATHGARMAEQVARAFPGNDETRMRDALAVVVAGVSQGVRERFDAFAEAERRLARERSDDGPIAEERNAAGSAVVSLLVEVRRAADNTSPTLSQTLGFNGDTPREFGAALSTGKSVLAQLNGLSPIPSTVLRGYSFDPAPYAADLGPALVRLDRAQAAWIADGRENDAAMVDRDRHRTRSDEGLRLGASLLSALLKGAGEDLLAARVLPGVRSGTVVEFDEPAPAPVVEPAA